MEENEIVESEGTENTGGEQPAPEAPEPGEIQQAAPEAAKSKVPEIDWSKAFEHPRFKELNQSRNDPVEQAKALKSELDALRQQFTQFQTPKTPSKEETEFESLISDLKKVDPRLASALESQQALQKQLAEEREWRENFSKQHSEAQRQATVKEMLTKINTQHESNKLDPTVRDILNSKLDALYMQGKLSPQNLEAEYKSALDGWNKFIEARDREITAKYVQSKKEDAKIPTSQPKGTPAKAAAKKPTWSKDPETARQQVVDRYIKSRQATKEADAG